jgi:HEAT repeat protein
VIASLDQYLPPKKKTPELPFVREVLYVMTRLPSQQAFPIIERLLTSTDAQTRRETTQVLGRFKEQRAGELCLNLLNDADIEVRATALDALVRLGARELARPILEHTVLAEGFDERSLSEKRRIYAAAAKLAGEDALKWFVNILQPGERRWFASRKEREGCEAIAHGIRIVGTQKANKLLQKLADQGDRFVRAACLKELGADRKV